VTRQLSNQTQQQTSTTSPLSSGIFQRKCVSCGQHTIAGGECAECQKKRSPLQRRATNQEKISEIPEIVREVLDSPGQPLDPKTRSFMELRLGDDFSPLQVYASGSPLVTNHHHEQEAEQVENKVSQASLTDEKETKTLIPHDFSQVRVHTDTRAAESARQLDAQAYTVGQHIVFAANQYAPNLANGRSLLAHELTHVVQQSAMADTVPIQRKKKAPNLLFYQEALDVLEKKTIIPESIPILEQFIELAKAVDQENFKAIPTLLKEFLSSDTDKLPLPFPSSPLIQALLSRMMMLGLDRESVHLRRWFIKHERKQSPPRSSRQKYSSRIILWENLLKELTNRIPEKGADVALRVLDALLIYFAQARNEAAGLDKDKIAEDRKRRAEISNSTSSIGSYDSPEVYLIEDKSIAAYYDTLLELLLRAFKAIQMAYQVVVDQAITDLGAGKGSKYLELAKDRLENRLKELIEPKEESKRVGSMTVEVTRSEFKKSGGKHIDYFLKGKAADKRTVNIQFYDKETSDGLASEKTIDFARAYTIRHEQILFLEHLYGLEKDKSGLTAETQENQDAIAKLGKTGLRLENDDDWRHFLLKKFELRKPKEGSEKALTAVIKLLERFLRVFTTHTPYNIDDFGDNLLTKTFPRTLTGQLIHDCGVYALRIAYMLSLLRDHKDLQLRFRYILLPVHIALIITGKNLPAYIAQNDRISVYSPQTVDELYKKWKKTTEQGEDRTGPEQDDEAQFVAELAAQEFIPEADMPFKLFDIPSTKNKSGTQIKNQLWNFYKEISATQLFGKVTLDSKSSLYQFHLQYLKVLDLIKTHHNTALLPFWNTIAHKAWKDHEPDLSKAFAKLQTAKAGKEQQDAKKAYDALVAEYLEKLKNPFEEVVEKHQPVIDAQEVIMKAVTEHPEVFGKGISRTFSSRIWKLFGNAWWKEDLEKHREELLLLRKERVAPPFAKPEDLLKPTD
jgi:hypothetical protein